MALPDYYKILDLDKQASPEQIWLSYNKLVFLNPLSQPEIEEAYFVLKHPELKQEYDNVFYRENFLGLSKRTRTDLAAFLTGFFSSIVVMLMFSLR